MAHKTKWMSTNAEREKLRKRESTAGKKDETKENQKGREIQTGKEKGR